MAHAIECPRCGGPLPPRARRVVVVCAYCGATISLDGEIVRAADFRRARERDGGAFASDPRLVAVGDEHYVLRGRLGRGASSDVFWGERARRCTERVVIKVLRCADDHDLFDREWSNLEALIDEGARARVSGVAHFAALVPERITRATLPHERPVHVFRLRSGFVHTLADVASLHGATLDPRHAVWMWRRVLEVLAWVHQRGFVHAAILPEHIVIHARDHGAMLVGWSSAERAFAGGTSSVRAIVSGREAFYPAAFCVGDAPAPLTDLIMLARTVAATLGGSDRMPTPLRALLETYVAEGSVVPTEDAYQLHSLVGEAAKKSFGPPTFVPFEMPHTR